MIDLTGIFTLWCFHNVRNSIPNNVYGYKSSKIFLGYVIYSTFAPINKKKYGIDIGSTIQYSNLILERTSTICSTKLDRIPNRVYFSVTNYSKERIVRTIRSNSDSVTVTGLFTDS